MPEQPINRSPILRIVVAQFITTLIVAALALIIGPVASTSALLAGGIAILPGLYTLMMSRRPVSADDNGLGLVLKGEIGRLVLAGVLFALVFTQVSPLDAVVLFGTFALLQVAYIVIPLIEARRLLQRTP